MLRSPPAAAQRALFGAMAGYRSYWFHFRGFLIGIPIVLVGSALLAAIASILA